MVASGVAQGLLVALCPPACIRLFAALCLGFPLWFGRGSGWVTKEWHRAVLPKVPHPHPTPSRESGTLGDGATSLPVTRGSLLWDLEPGSLPSLR